MVALRDRLTVPVLALGGSLMAVMQVVVVPLLPELPRLTGASAGAVSWMVTATLLTGAVLNPVLGRAGDMYGKKKVLLIALGMMTVGSLMCALTSDIRILIAARALQGPRPPSYRCRSASCGTNCRPSARVPRWR